MENDVAEIVEETSSLSNSDVVALQQQQQQQQQLRHATSGKGPSPSATTSSNASSNGVEILGWDSAASALGNNGAIHGNSVGEDDFDQNGADMGDFYGSGNGGVDGAGFGHGNSGDELELMNLLNANLSSQKIDTLKRIQPLNACVKGTPENRLSTSLCYDFGKGERR